jgi:hypothetical protein
MSRDNDKLAQTEAPPTGGGASSGGEETVGGIQNWYGGVTESLNPTETLQWTAVCTEGHQWHGNPSASRAVAEEEASLHNSDYPGHNAHAEQTKMYSAQG